MIEKKATTSVVSLKFAFFIKQKMSPFLKILECES